MRSLPRPIQPDSIATISGVTRSQSIPRVFIIDGQEWRGFFNPVSRNFPPKPNEIVGDLILSKTTNTYAVTFEPAKSDGSNYANHNFVVHLTYIGTGIRHQIKRGENAGQELSHDFVVLAWDQATLVLDAAILTGSFKRSDVKGATAVAAWVSRSDDPTPIQAVAGWL